MQLLGNLPELQVNFFIKLGATFRQLLEILATFWQLFRKIGNFSATFWVYFSNFRENVCQLVERPSSRSRPIHPRSCEEQNKLNGCVTARDQLCDVVDGDAEQAAEK